MDDSRDEEQHEGVVIVTWVRERDNLNEGSGHQFGDRCKLERDFRSRTDGVK